MTVTIFIHCQFAKISICFVSQSIASQFVNEKTETTRPDSERTTEDENLFEVDLNSKEESAVKDDVIDGDLSNLNSTMNGIQLSAGKLGSLFDDDATGVGSHGDDDLFATPDARKSAFEKTYQFDVDGDDEDILE